MEDTLRSDSFSEREDDFSDRGDYFTSESDCNDEEVNGGYEGPQPYQFEPAARAREEQLTDEGSIPGDRVGNTNW